jgi:hypothetical protein
MTNEELMKLWDEIQADTDLAIEEFAYYINHRRSIELKIKNALAGRRRLSVVPLAPDDSSHKCGDCAHGGFVARQSKAD